MIEISIIIPVYNEEKSIIKILDDIDFVIGSNKLSYEIIVVNDYSEDKTDELLKGRNNIKIVNNKYNLGYGASIKRGIKASSGTWIFIIDSDGTYPVKKFLDFLPYMKDYDMIVGARTTKNNQTPPFRKFPKKLLNNFASWLINFKIPDLNSGMRLFKKEFCLEFWNLYPQRFSFTSTITMAFIKSNYMIKYVPIDYYERVGQSSIRPWNFFSFIGLVFRIAFYFQPLKFLMPIILLLLSVGSVKGVYDFIYLNHIGNFSIFLLVVALLLFFIAIMADLLFKQR